MNLDWLEFSTARQTRRLPVVLTHADVLRVLEQLPGRYPLMVELPYGSGLRLNDSNLRVKDLYFDLKMLTERSGKATRIV